MGQVVNRIGSFYLECARAEIEAAKGHLDGFLIWGDMAYARGTFVSPSYWREYFKPWVAEMAAVAHGKGLPVIYHGCGNVKEIFEDFIEIGVDAYNPLEAKAGLDVLDLRRRYGHRMGFCGNSDVQVWETGDEQALEREVLRKLNAARGGGYIFQSDHSVSSEVSGHTYDAIVRLVREYGTYPLKLGVFEENLQ
jgi:uroporphyrinogen-III decarboxylase